MITLCEYITTPWCFYLTWGVVTLLSYIALKRRQRKPLDNRNTNPVER